MIHSFITISSDAGAVECTGPSPKLLGSAALTKHGDSSCQSEDKHTHWAREGTTGERVVEMKEEGESDKARESDSKRALKEKQGERLTVRGSGWDPRFGSGWSQLYHGPGFLDKRVFTHWWIIEQPQTQLPTPTILAKELHCTAALWTFRKLLKLAVNVLTL